RRSPFQVGRLPARPPPLSPPPTTTAPPPADRRHTPHDRLHRWRDEPLPDRHPGSGAGALDLSLPSLYNGVYPSKGMGSDESEERVAKDTSWTLLSTAVN